MKFAYTYVLANARTKRLYIGFSKNLRQRVVSHQKRDPDWQLAYYEATLRKLMPVRESVI